MKKHHIITRNHKQHGQILLITVMLLATAITVVLSVSFSSNTETQITKLEEESQKALAAAEAGIEVALQKKIAANNAVPTIAVGGYNTTATVTESINPLQFVTPLLQTNNVYTFYLSNYPSLSDPFQQNLTIYYQSSEGPDLLCTDNSLELTLVYGPTGHYLMKKFTVSKATGSKLAGTANLSLRVTPNTINQKVFQCETSLNLAELNGSDLIYPEPRALFVRALFKETEVAFVSTSRNLPKQGVIITSEARSESSGVTKRVRLFQSYPQIPVEFFVTRF